MLTLYPCLKFRQRLLGLHGFAPLGENEGLWILPCHGVHTLGLKNALDVVFLDAHDQPLRVYMRLPPNRSAWCWRASSVVELAAGFCQNHADYARQIVQQCAAIRQRSGAGSGHRLPECQKR